MVPANSLTLASSAEAALQDLERRAQRGDAKARSIVRRARSLAAVLLADALHGDPVRKRSLPQALVRRHGIANLYVEDLPDFWRLLYTIVRAGQQVHVVVVEIVDHRAYDRWFPGRGR